MARLQSGRRQWSSRRTRTVAYNQALGALLNGANGPVDVTSAFGQWLIGTATDENGVNVNGWNGYADNVSHITNGTLTLASYINSNLDFQSAFIQGGSFINGFVLAGANGRRARSVNRRG